MTIEFTPTLGQFYTNRERMRMLWSITFEH